MNARYSQWCPCRVMKRRILQVMSPLVLCCLLLAQSASGGSVTVVTHGADFLGAGGPFNAMGGELFNYWDAQPGGAVEYKYDKSSLGLTALQGDIANANKIIVFDWASESDRSQGGYDEAAGDALFATLVAHDLLDSDYLHLIGHSRGTIVSTQAARRILYYGYTLNQLTLLDTEPGPSPYSDAGPARAWEEIDFVDNYYGYGTGISWPFEAQLKGEPIAGAHDVYWPTDHSGVHEWYTASINNGVEDGYYWRVTDQPKPNPTGSPTPVISPPDIVNGNFDYGVLEIPITGVPVEYKATQIAGWNLHGGGGTGHVDYNFTADYELELDYGDASKTHNWLFAPEDAVQLMFDAKVDISSSNDDFIVSLRRYDGFGRQYEPLSLRSPKGWTSYAVDISEYTGSVFRFAFGIITPGTFNFFVDSQVQIDNVRFLFIPEPATILLAMLGLVSACCIRRRR